MKRPVWVSMLLTGLIFLFIQGCSNPAKPGGTNPNNPVGDIKIKLDLKGAKALGATSGTVNRSARAASDQGGLIKILDDGTVETALDLSAFDPVPAIRFILKSPVSNDIFICFASDLFSWTQNEYGQGVQNVYGSFIHLKEDGTAVVIVKRSDNNWNQVASPNGNSSENNLITFDSAGNLYFIEQQSSNSSSTNIIKKYSVSTGTVSQITASIPNTSYESLAISVDGQYLVVKANRWSNNTSVSYIRQIPVLNADAYENLYYSNNGGVNIGYAISKTDNSVYLSGYLGDNIGGILKSYVENGTVKQEYLYSSSNDNQWFSFYGDNNSSNITGLFYWDEGIYRWCSYWKTNGVPDTKRILEYISAQFVEPVIFTYKGETGIDAVNAIDPDELMKYFQDNFQNNFANEFEKKFFNLYCTNELGQAAKTFEAFKVEAGIPYFSFQNFNQLFHLGDNSLWGIYSFNSSKKIVQLLNSSHKKALVIPSALRNEAYKPVKLITSGTKIIFSNAIYNGTVDTGFQKLYAMDAGQVSAEPVDLFVNVPNSNRLEIFDFSVTGNMMYFSASSGSSIICGKINIDTREYSQISTGQNETADEKNAKKQRKLFLTLLQYV